MLEVMLLNQHLVSSSKTSICLILRGHDILGFPESRGLWFYLMRHIHRSMYEQVPFVLGCLESSTTSAKAVELYPSRSGQTHAK